MPEKLALKKALMKELHDTQMQIDQLKKWDSVEVVYLNAHREFILKLIGICTERNKF